MKKEKINIVLYWVFFLSLEYDYIFTKQEPVLTDTLSNMIHTENIP